MTSISAHFWAAFAAWKAIQTHEAVNFFFLPNSKIVLTRMLCPYQFQGGSSPAFCDVYKSTTLNGEKKKKPHKKTESFAYYEMEKKVLTGTPWHFKQ